MADIQAARKWARGAAVNGKVFIADGVYEGQWLPKQHQCEVYNETTNEWHFIRCYRESLRYLLAVDNKLYAVEKGYTDSTTAIIIECYNPDKDEWKLKTKKPDLAIDATCSVKFFKGLAESLPSS